MKHGACHGSCEGPKSYSKQCGLCGNHFYVSFGSSHMLQNNTPMCDTCIENGVLEIGTIDFETHKTPIDRRKTLELCLNAMPRYCAIKRRSIFSLLQMVNNQMPFDKIEEAIRKLDPDTHTMKEEELESLRPIARWSILPKEMREPVFQEMKLFAMCVCRFGKVHAHKLPGRECDEQTSRNIRASVLSKVETVHKWALNYTAAEERNLDQIKKKAEKAERIKKEAEEAERIKKEAEAERIKKEAKEKKIAETAAHFGFSTADEFRAHECAICYNKTGATHPDQDSWKVMCTSNTNNNATHAICTECFNKYSKLSTRCPMCRGKSTGPQ